MRTRIMVSITAACFCAGALTPLDRAQEWALRATTGPPTQWEHAMAYDSARGVTVMVGLGETWELSHACYPDCDSNGVLDFFDFLCFQNSFVNSEPYACECDLNPACSFFDFLCFQDAFVNGCP